MSGSFEIRIEGLPGFTEAMRQAPEILTRNLLSAANASALYGESIAKQHAPVAFGNLRSSIQAQPATVIPGGVSAIVGVGALYGYWAEYGRGPGKMPPQGAVTAWMNLKGIPPEAEFLVRRAIGRHGTKGKPFMQPAADALAGGIAEKLFGDAIDKALNEIGGGS